MANATEAGGPDAASCAPADASAANRSPVVVGRSPSWADGTAVAGRAAVGSDTGGAVTLGSAGTGGIGIAFATICGCAGMLDVPPRRAVAVAARAVVSFGVGVGTAGVAGVEVRAEFAVASVASAAVCAAFAAWVAGAPAGVESNPPARSSRSWSARVRVAAGFAVTAAVRSVLVPLAAAVCSVT